MGTPVCSVPGSGLGGVGDRERYWTLEGFIEELTVSWDLDEEQRPPRWRRGECLRQRKQHMHRLQGGNSPVCAGFGVK